jgi:predicted PurR-regulated permease PerM
MPAAAEPARPAARPGVLTATWNAVTGAVGAAMGLLPHLLHHVGLLGGAVLVSGATGNILFAALGLVLSVPLLRRLHRRFGTWRAPALALAVFAVMFSVSAFVVGPAISSGEQSPDRVPVETPGPGSHDSHHGG